MMFYLLIKFTGDCYLKEWSEWSLCQLTCVNGEDLGFGGIQVRSRAVIIQDLENQHLCPEQALETRPCNGKHQNTHHSSCNKKIQNYSMFLFFLLRLSKLGKYGFGGHRNALNFYFPNINCVPEKLGRFNYYMFPLQKHFFNPS